MDLKAIFRKEKQAADEQAADEAAKRQADKAAAERTYQERITSETARLVELHRILKAEAYDKKFLRGKNRYVLPVAIGKVKVVEGVSYATIRRVLKDALA